jgi:ATP-binding cassette, subfamily B, bacterial
MTVLPTTLSAFFWRCVRQQPVSFAVYQCAALAWGLDQTLWPIYFKYLVDGLNGYKGDPAGVFHALGWLLWLGLALMLVIDVMFRIMGFTGVRLWSRLDASVHRAMFEYTQLHSARYFSDHFAGSLANKIADMSQNVVGALQIIIVVLPPVFLGLFIALGMMARVHPFFALLLVAWFVVHFAVSIIASQGIARRSEVHSEARSVLQGKVIDSLSNFMNVAMFARIPFERRYVEGFREEERKANRANLMYTEKSRVLLSINGMVAYGAMGWLILRQWQIGGITMGDVVFLLSATWNVQTIVWQMGMQWLPNLYRNLGICRQALSIIRVPHEVVDAPDAGALNVAKGEITFDRVSFHYRKGRDIFSDKSLTLAGGKRVGLVGFSGSGKTTFVHLVLRLFDVERGGILIDGQDIKQITQDSLRSQIAMIPQDTTLFHRTLMENIRYGRPDASDEEVIEASRRAHCHEFIMQLEEGYQALVGERGIKLSGGQRQRIAIARAMLKDAPILILDEATSSLDSVTERTIKESLAQLMHGRTTIVIAHRLSTLADMDRILVFDAGRIIEDGTHTELLARGGHYAKMWNMQAGGFLPEEEG